MLFRDAAEIVRAFASRVPQQYTLAEATRLAHALRVASAILGVGRDPGAHECLRRMTSGEMDLAARTTSQGKDALWELELTDQLQRRGFAVRLAEPDIVLEHEGGDYALAAKRVYSERGVKAQMRKGVQQIERAGSPGLVAFNIDEQTPPGTVLESTDPRAAGDFLAGLNRKFIDRHVHEFAEFVARNRCHGVMVTTNVVADLKRSTPRIVTYSETTIWTLGGRPIAPALDSLVEKIKAIRE